MNIMTRFIECKLLLFNRY